MENKFQSAVTLLEMNKHIVDETFLRDLWRHIKTDKMYWFQDANGNWYRNPNISGFMHTSYSEPLPSGL